MSVGNRLFCAKILIKSLIKVKRFYTKITVERNDRFYFVLRCMDIKFRTFTSYRVENTRLDVESK